MRRSVCYSEPSVALAGSNSDWKFIYTPSVSLPKGTKLKFDLQSSGRLIDWEIPESDLSSDRNVIYGLAGENKPISAKMVNNPEHFIPQFEFVLTKKLDSGESFTVILGANPKKKKKSEGNQIQTYVQRRRSCLLYIDPTGKGHYQDPEVFTLDIRGNELKNIRILTPSFVTRNKRFDVTIRFEDAFGNLTNNTAEDTLIELSYDQLRENLNWKIFVPETGFITLPNLYFNEEGVYTIKLKNLLTGDVYRSAPIKCFSQNASNLFWGLLHGESDRVDSTENIENCLRHFRDDKAVNFFSVSPFENPEETSNDLWKNLGLNIQEFNEPDRFTTFLGFQRVGTPGEEGQRLILYPKDSKIILRKKESKYSTLKKIYKAFLPKDIISIPTFTMGKGYGFDFKNFNPDFERVVEIYNAWGSSECSKKEGNSRPISSTDKNGVKEFPEGSIQKALLANYRFGFVGGGLDDRGIYSDLFDSDQEQYSPGLTGIIADVHNRESLFESIYNRSCYATTGAKIIVGLHLAGFPMGKEISTESKPGLVINRHLSGYIVGSDAIQSLEIIRNGKVLKSYSYTENTVDFVYDDMDPISEIVLKGKGDQLPFVYYYLRVTQKDGHMAWSSPIWVDYVATDKLKKVPKKGKA